MSNILPSKILNSLARFDVCVNSGKLYNSIPNSSFATDPMQKRLSYWIKELDKNDINMYTLEFMIASYRLKNYENKIVYKFLFDTYENVKDNAYKFLAYNQNISFNFMGDLRKYITSKNPFNFDEGIHSTLYRSLMVEEYNIEFYIIMNYLMDITSYWKGTKVPLMKDVIKFLDNSMPIVYYAYKDFNVESIITSEDFFNEAEDIIYGRR